MYAYHTHNNNPPIMMDFFISAYWNDLLKSNRKWVYRVATKIKLKEQPKTAAVFFWSFKQFNTFFILR
jgi:hypothetical protein